MDKKSQKKKEDIKFEEAFELLKKEAEKIRSDSVSIEEATECYKNGKKYYDICVEKLAEAKQTIELYDKESGTLKEL